MNRKQRRAQQAMERRERREERRAEYRWMEALHTAKAIEYGVALGIFEKDPDGGYISTEVGTALLDGKISRSERPDLYEWVDRVALATRVIQGLKSGRITYDQLAAIV